MTGIGQRLIRIREELSLNKRKFALSLDINPSQYGRIESEEVGLTNKQLLDIHNKYSVSIDWLISGDGKMYNNFTHFESDDLDIVKNHDISYTELNLLDFDAYAGMSDYFAGHISEKTEKIIFPFIEKGEADFAIRVSGESMSPTILDGDIAACRIVLDTNEIRWNMPYIVSTENQGVVIKRIVQHISSNDDLVLKSDNELFTDFRIPKMEIKNVAFVVKTMRTF